MTVFYSKDYSFRECLVGVMGYRKHHTASTGISLWVFGFIAIAIQLSIMQKSNAWLWT